MNSESDDYLIKRYRSVALDEPPASLDRAILTLARRRAARVRTVRRGIGLCAMLAAAVALATLSQRPHTIKARPIPVRTGYGLQEGATRYYLLTVSAVPSGAIDLEVKP